MREWKLIRIRDNHHSETRYSDTQPPFNPAFGRQAEFRWDSRDLSTAEWSFIRREFKRERMNDLFPRFIDAYYEDRVLGDPTEMNQLMTRIGQIRSQDPT